MNGCVSFLFGRQKKGARHSRVRLAGLQPATASGATGKRAPVLQCGPSKWNMSPRINVIFAVQSDITLGGST